VHVQAEGDTLVEGLQGGREGGREGEWMTERLDGFVAHVQVEEGREGGREGGPRRTCCGSVVE